MLWSIVGDSFRESFLDKSVYGDVFLSGKVGNIPVSCRRNSYIESAGIAFFGLYSLVFTKYKVIVNSFMKCVCYFLYRFSFIIDKIIDSFQLSKENLIRFAIVY